MYAFAYLRFLSVIGYYVMFIKIIIRLRPWQYLFIATYLPYPSQLNSKRVTATLVGRALDIIFKKKNTFCPFANGSQGTSSKPQ